MTPTSDWTEQQAMDMMRAGYGVKHVSNVTGFEVMWLLEQPWPREPLVEKLGRKVGGSKSGVARRTR